MIARSWKIRIPNSVRPCRVSTSRRSCRIFITIAVLESDMMNPKTTAALNGTPREYATNVMATIVVQSWIRPPMMTIRQDLRSLSNENSSPIVKSRSMIPISPTVSIDDSSVMSPKP